ncbi:retrovirus-related pol polyprotein from transposon TNT 1-94 [Tanacetum coccineum]
MKVNSSVAINDSVYYVEKCNKCLKLEVELIKQHNMIEKDEYNKLSNSFSKLEQHYISLELAMQLNKEIFQKNNTSVNQTEPTFDQLFELNNLKAELQAKETTIEQLKENIKHLNKTSTINSVKKDIDEIETINIELEHRVGKVIAENEHLKQTYKQLYDSIKPSCVCAKKHTKSLVNRLNQKSIEITYLNAQLQEKVFVITTLKNDLRKLKGKNIVNNADLVEIVEQAKLLNPLDSASYFACKYVKLIQGLLGYVRDTCPDIHKPSKKLVAVTPINKKKIVRSKSIDNKKNDMILQISSSTQKKNKVEDHSRIVKSCLNKRNCVVKPSGNANVQHSKLNTNFELICVKCNSFMFDARHELCFLEFVSDMNVCSKSKSIKKAKKKEEWKPTGKVFTKIRYNWRPKGTTFTLVGNACPLTRITATNKVAFREPVALEVVAQEPVVTKVYTRRPKVHKTIGSNIKPKIAKSMISNKMELGTSRGSNTSVAPSSSSLVNIRPMRVASINRKKYIIVIVDDYSRFTWVKFLASKDEAPDFIIKFLKMIQVRLNACTDNGTEFVNQTLCSYYESVGISLKTSVAQTPQQNGVVERQNRTLLTAMASKQLSLGPGLQLMTPATSSSGLISNPIPQQPCNPPQRDNWDLFFQSMFDEYFNLPTIAVSPVPIANTPRAVDLADSSVSTSIDQDAPSTSIPST